ncbi:MAG: ECF-type sigma factor [Longimicrobiaceae bacterium]
MHPDPQDPGTEAAGALTLLLRSAADGDHQALDAFFARVYEELRRLASQVRRGRAGETLSTTALVHEAYLKLVPSAEIEWESRAHFFAVAARAMRQVLVSAARRRLAEKRGGGDWLVTLGDSVPSEPVRPERLLALDEALARLAAMDERQARIVEQRFFAGLTVEETAEVLGLSERTVKRDWRAARAWLAAELQDDDT